MICCIFLHFVVVDEFREQFGVCALISTKWLQQLQKKAMKENVARTETPFNPIVGPSMAIAIFSDGHRWPIDGHRWDLNYRPSLYHFRVKYSGMKKECNLVAQNAKNSLI